MALYVQLPDDEGTEVHHRVESFANIDTDANDPMQSTRSYVTGCGQKVDAFAHRMAEADVEPGGEKCKDGCFAAAKKGKS